MTLADGDTGSSFAALALSGPMTWSGYDGLTVTGATTLSGGTVTLDSNGGAISLASLTGGGQDLVLGAGIGAGSVTVTGAVSNLGDGTGAALTVQSGVTGLVDFQGVFGGNSGVSAASGTTVRFAGDVTLADGDTGSSFAALALSGPMTWSGYDGLTVTGATTLSGGTVTLDSNGGAISLASITGGGQDLVLGAGIGAGSVTVTGAVSNLGDGTGAALTVQSGVTGLVDFQGVFGGNSGVSAASGTTVRFAGDVTLADGDTGSSFAALALSGPMTWSGYDGLTVTGATTLSGGTVTLDSNGGAISLASITGGGQDLVLGAGIGAGSVTVTGAVSNLGDGTGAALTVQSGVTGLVDFQGVFGGNSGVIAASGTTVRFAGDVTLADGDTGSSFAALALSGPMTWSGYDGLTVTGATTLSGGTVTLDSNGGAISLASITGGGQDLVLGAGIGAGSVTVTGAVSNLGDGTGAALTVQSGVTGLVDFQGVFGGNSGVIAASGSTVRFAGDVTLADGDTGSSFAALALSGPMTWSGYDGLTVTGATTLSGGTVTLDSNGGAISLASITGGGQDLVLGAGIGAGSVTVTGAVSNLGDGTGAALTVQSGVTGLVDFQGVFGGNSGVIAASGTTVRFAGDVTLTDGDTGSSFAALALSGPMTWSGYDGLTVTGATTLSGGTVTLDSNGGAISLASITGGGQDLVLGAGIGAGSVTVTGAVSNLGDGTGAALTVQSGVTGLVDFQGVFGGNSGVSAASGTTVRFAGDVTLADGDTGSSFAALALSGPMTWSGYDGLTVTGATTLSGGTVTLDSNGGNIHFMGTLDSVMSTAHALTLNAGTGNIDFDGVVGGTTALGDVTVSSATNVTADMDFNAESFTQSAGTGSTTFSGAVVTTGDNGTHGVEIRTAGSIVFSRTLNTNNHSVFLASATIDVPTTLTASEVTLTTYNPSHTIGLEDATRDLNFTDAELDAIVVPTLILGDSSNTGGIWVGGEITQTKNLRLRTAGGISLGGDITTVNRDIDLDGAVTLTSGVSLATGAMGGDITFRSTLTGPFDLTLNTGTGAVTVTGAVSNLGDGTGAALTVQSGVTGLVDFQGVFGGNSGVIAASGTTVRFAGDVTLADGDTGSSFAALALSGPMTWSGYDGLTVTGATTLSGGTVTLDSNGGAISLASITGGGQDLVLGAGIGAGSVTVTGAVSNLGDGTGAALTVQSGVTGLVDFQGVFGGNSGVSAASGTTVRFAGDVTLADGDTGSSFAALALSGPMTWSGYDGLTVTGATTLSGGTVTLDSNGGAISLASLTGGGQDLVLGAGIGAGSVTVTGAVSNLGDGTGAALTVQSGVTGLVDFQGVFGGNSGVIAASGTTVRFAGDVTLADGDTGSSFAALALSGPMTWSGYDGLTVTGATTLSGGTVTLDSNGGAISLASLTGGGQDLVLGAGIGAGSVTVTGAVSNLGDGTGAALTVQSGVTGLVDFQGVFGGNSGVIAASGTTVRFAGDVTLADGDTGSSFAALALSGPMTWSGYDGLTVTGATTLSGGTVTLDSNGGAISLASITGGGQDLVLGAGIGAGSVTVTGAVSNLGDGTGAALTVQSGVTGLVDFQGVFGGNSGVIAASGTTVRFAGDVTLADGDTGSSFAALALSGPMTWSGYDGLTVTGATTLSGGTVTLDSNGGAISLASLTGGGQDLVLGAGIGAGSVTVTGAVSNLGDGTGAALTVQSGVTGLVDFQGVFGGNSGVIAASGTTVRFAGDVTLADGDTGSSFAALALSGPMTWSGYDGLTVTGATTLSGGTVTLDSNGGAISLASLTGGGQDLVLGAGIGAGSVTVTGAVSNLGDGTGAALTVQSGVTGLVDFQGVFGGNSGVIAASGTTVRFAGDVTLADGDTGSSFAALALSGPMTWSGYDGLTVTGATTLSGGTVTLDSNGGAISLASITGGGQDLVLGAGIGAGSVTVTGAVSNLGDGTGAALTVQSGVTGLVDFQGVFGGNSGVIAASGTTVRFAGDVTLADGDTGSSFAALALSGPMTWSGYDGLTVTGATTLSGGTVTLDSNGGAISLASITGGGQDLVLGAGIGAGSVTVTGAVSNLGDGTGAALTVQSGVTGLVDFQGVFGGNSGVIAASGTTVRFAGDVTLADGDTGSSFAALALSGPMTWSGYDGLTVTGATTLSGGMVTLDSNGGAISLASLTGGGQDLVLGAGIGAGSVTVTGAVSNLGDGTGAALTVQSGVTGLVDFQGVFGGNSGVIAASGSTVRFAGDVTLADGDTGSSFAALALSGPMTWSGYDGLTVTGATTLSGGTVTLDSNGGAISLASLTGGGQDLVLGAGIGAGSVTVTGAVSNLGDGTGAALTVQSGVTGLVDFQGVFGGNSGVIAASGTTVRFAGDVTLADGDTGSSLAALALSGPMTWSGYDGLTVTGATTLSGGTVTLDSNGGAISLASLTGGGQDLVLGAGIGAGSVTVTGAVSNLGDGTGAALTVQSGVTGLVDFQGVFGGNSGVIAASGTTVRFAGDVTLADGDTGSSFAALALSGPMTWSGYDGLTVTGATTLSGGTVTLDSNGGAISLASITGGGQDLVLGAGIGAGSVTVTGAVSNLGDGTGAALTVQSGVTGLVDFQGVFGGNSGVIAASGSTVRFAGDVTLADGDTGSSFAALALSGPMTWSGYDGLTVTGATTLSGGTVTLDSNGGAISLASITGGGQDLVLGAGIGAGSVTVTGAVSNLGDGTGAALTVQSGVTGLVDFQGVFGGNSGVIAASGSTVRFAGDVTLADGDTGSSFAALALSGPMTWSGYDGLTVTGATTLSGGTVTLDSNGGAISLASITGGGQDLVLGAGIGAGSVTVTGAVSNLGDGTGAALTVQSGVTGLVDFQGVFGGNSGVIAASGSTVRFAGDVTLADGDTGSSFAALALSGPMTWSGYDGLTVTGATTLSGGTVTLDSNGGAISLASITGGGQDLVLGAGIGAGSVTVTGAVSNLGDGTGAALTVQSGVTGLVDFQGVFGGNSGVIAASGSTVRFAGDVTLADGDTGSSLAALALSGPMTWSGYDGLTVTGATTLSGGTVTLDSNGGAISLASITGGGQDLVLGAGIGAGSVTVTGAVSNLGDGTGAALTVQSGVTGLVDFQGVFGGNSGVIAASGTTVRFAGDVTLADGDTGTNIAGSIMLSDVTFSGFDGITFGATTLTGRNAVYSNGDGNTIDYASFTGDGAILTLRSDGELVVDNIDLGATGMFFAIVDHNNNEDATLQIRSVPVAASVTYTGSTDTLMGADVATVWTINGENTGTLNSGGRDDSFVNFASLTGGEADDTFVVVDATSFVTGVVDGGEHDNSDALDYSSFQGGFIFDLANPVVPNIDFRNIERFIGNSDIGFEVRGLDSDEIWHITGENSFTVAGVNFEGVPRLTGGSGEDTFRFEDGGVITGLIDGGAGDDTLDYDSNDVTGVTVTLSDIDNIETLRGEETILVGTTGTRNLLIWNLNMETGGTVSDNILNPEIMLSFTGVSNVHAAAAPNDKNTFTANGEYTGVVTLPGNDNTWIYTQGKVLTRGTVEGGGALTINRHTRSSPNTGDLTVGVDDLNLPALNQFSGHLVIGGFLDPAGFFPLTRGNSGDTINIYTETLTVSSSIDTGGPLTLLAGDIVLNADITAGDTIAMMAVGPLVSAQLRGDITAQVPVVLTAPLVQDRASGEIIASGNIINSNNINLAFSGGEVDVATGSNVATEFNRGSFFSDVTTYPGFTAFLRFISEEQVINGAHFTNVDIVRAYFSPTIGLTGLEALAFIDVGLFDRELTLFSSIGTGIALPLAQCEEQEGCAPSVSEDELDELIENLEARLLELEKRLVDEGIKPEEQADIETLIEGFNEELQKFRVYRKELKDFFAAEEEAFEDDEELIGDGEALPGIESDADKLTRLTNILKIVRARIAWLENLKEESEERTRLGRKVGVELNLEALDAIIEGAGAEAVFIENRIRLLIERIEAMLTPAPMFRAEARDYNSVKVVHYTNDGLSSLDSLFEKPVFSVY